MFIANQSCYIKYISVYFSKGWLGGAVLDVFATEPLHKESRLWNLPGVLITPHVAGVSLTNQVGCFLTS